MIFDFWPSKFIYKVYGHITYIIEQFVGILLLLLFSLLLEWGANVVGTIAQYYWFPFVYSKMESGDANTETDKHNRTKVST